MASGTVHCCLTACHVLLKAHIGCIRCCLKSDKFTLPDPKYSDQQSAAFGHLQHRPSMLCIGGCMPHAARGQPLRYCLPGVRHQAFPLHIHTMLLIPGGPRPTYIHWLRGIAHATYYSEGFAQLIKVYTAFNSILDCQGLQHSEGHMQAAA